MTPVSAVESLEKKRGRLVHTLVSSRDDWDRYEGLQWYATAEYARTHPEDPDLATVVGRVEKAKAAYLRWGRDTLGWAIYLFRRRTPRIPGRSSLEGVFRRFLVILMNPKESTASCDQIASYCPCRHYIIVQRIA